MSNAGQVCMKNSQLSTNIIARSSPSLVHTMTATTVEALYTTSTAPFKGVFIATQLNSTQLSPINERSDPVDSVCRS